MRTISKIISSLTALAVAASMLPAVSLGEGFSNDTATVQIYAFNDDNNNGIRGKYEESVDGVKVGAYMASGSTMELKAEGVTGKNGVVTFDNLPAGTYYFKAELPDNYGFTKSSQYIDKDSSIFDYANETEAVSAPVSVEGGNLEMGLGCLKYSFVSGSCFVDENSDGIWQDDEPGLAGVKVEILSKPKGILISEAVSDENGDYRVGYVLPGDKYTLRATLPDGVAFTKYSKQGRERRSILTSAGESTDEKECEVYKKGTTDQNIGGVYSAVVTGICFRDNVFNGVRDEGEEGIPGVTVEVVKQNGSVAATGVSDENGEFSFTSLRNETYNVRVTLPDGYVYTMACDGGNLFTSKNGRLESTITGFDVEYPLDKQIIVGAIHLGTVSGKVYFDDDCSGKMDGAEKAANGISVELLDDSGAVIATDRTAGSGEYKFEGLNPGNYSLRMTAKAGFAFTRKGEGSVVASTSGGNGQSDVFTLEMGEDKTKMDAGMLVPAEISGIVFDDENENGTKDSSEVGLVGTQVRLIGEDGEAASAVIGEDGRFVFDSVMPGTYHIRYELVGNSYFTKTVSGGNAVYSAENYADTADFSVNAKEKAEMPLCGGVALYQLEGAFFHDLNGNGKVDSGETAMSGVTVTLKHSGSEDKAIVTDETGKFAFTSMVPGNYTFSYVLPDDNYTTRVISSDLGISSDKNSEEIAFTADRKHIYTLQNVGAANHVSIEGKIWIDENRNGACDIDEYVPEGEEISVVSEDSAEAVAVVTTDENGIFELHDITPGTYTLSYSPDDETAPAPEGDSTFSFSNSHSEELTMENILLTSGEYFRDAKLGIIRSSSVAGTVWLDDSGEIVPVEGARVNLSNGNSAVTGADGTYVFTDLDAGEYSISAELPAGMIYAEQSDRRLEEGGHVSIISSNQSRTGFSETFSLRMGERKVNADVGAVMSSSLGDRVWLDENSDGMQDNGEMGMPGVTVTLYRVGVDEPIGQVTTDAFGYYCFKDLYPAEYIIKAEYPAEVKPAPMVDVPLISSVLQENGNTDVIELESGARHYNADLGFTLVKPGKYPAEYGNVPTQDWTAAANQ